MIKANDLRIGNVVLYKPYGNRDGEMKTIQGTMGMKAYFDRHSNESGMYHNLQGIPLTVEWLHKFGFSFDNSFYYNGLRLSLKFVRYDPSESYLQLDSPFGSTTLYFVHQLQNWFFGNTQQELEVKL